MSAVRGSPSRPEGSAPRAVVHVWVADPDATDACLRATYLRLLSEDERARLHRFRRASDQGLYLVAHGMLRCALSRFADLAAHQWRFVTNAHGRPSIDPAICPLPIRFNLSHTPGRVAIAVSAHREIGVDIEHVLRDTPLELADSVFATREVRSLFALPQPRQRSRFFEYWTLKESYIKARGLGLALPLDQFWFELHGREDIEIAFDRRMGDDPQRWQFSSRALGDHRLAVCVERTDGTDAAIEVHETLLHPSDGSPPCRNTPRCPATRTG